MVQNSHICTSANPHINSVSFRSQRKPNRSSYIWCTSYMDRLSMRFDNMFTDSQPQTGSAFVAASGCIGPVKSFEYSLKVFFFNANTIVSDFDQHMFFIRFINTRNNTSARLSIFAGIFHEVDENHPDFFLVSKNIDRRFATFFYCCPDTL